MSRRPKPRTEVAGITFVTESFWERVTKTEHCWEWTGGKGHKGYGQVNAKKDGRKTILNAHKASYLLHIGPVADGMKVDHTCHNHGCVNPDHLRQVTNKQNLENRAGLPSNNTSGHLGVFWDTRVSKWAARVRHNDKQHHLGHFATAETAAEAARDIRLELFTHNDLDRRQTA